MNPLSENTVQQSALHERIRNFSIDNEGDELTFSQRLAADNGWSLAFALEVIEEYKRFAFLAISVNHPVTPSDQVDQAWHLHLAYTHSYWEEFCPQILQTSLHHNPTKGGEVENAKFEDWYERTLESYEQFFGEAPNPEIWPSVAVRFNRADAFLRVNTRRTWTIPKPPIPRELVGGTMAALSFGLGLWFAVTSNSSANLVGGVLIAVMSAIASYSLIQLVAGFLDALNKPMIVGGCGGGGGCGYTGCGGCGG